MAAVTLIVIAGLFLVRTINVTFEMNNQPVPAFGTLDLTNFQLITHKLGIQTAKP